MSYIHQLGGPLWALLRPPANFLPTRHRRPPGKPEDTPALLLLAPLSGMDPNAPRVANPLGDHTRKRKRKRAAEVDAPRARKMRAEGCEIEDIATALNVSTRSVCRAIAVKRRAYRGSGNETSPDPKTEACTSERNKIQ